MITPEQRVAEILKDRLPIDMHHYQYQELAAEILSSLTTEDEEITSEKYEHLYFQAKDLARLGKLNDEKLKILKDQGAKRAMARFMSTLPDNSEEKGE